MLAMGSEYSGDESDDEIQTNYSKISGLGGLGGLGSLGGLSKGLGNLGGLGKFNDSPKQEIKELRGLGGLKSFPAKDQKVKKAPSIDIFKSFEIPESKPEKPLKKSSPVAREQSKDKLEDMLIPFGSKIDESTKRIEGSIEKVLLRLENLALDNHTNKLADAFLKVVERPTKDEEREKCSRLEDTVKDLRILIDQKTSENNSLKNLLEKSLEKSEESPKEIQEKAVQIVKSLLEKKIASRGITILGRELEGVFDDDSVLSLSQLVEVLGEEAKVTVSFLSSL